MNEYNTAFVAIQIYATFESLRPYQAILYVGVGEDKETQWTVPLSRYSDHPEKLAVETHQWATHAFQTVSDVLLFFMAPGEPPIQKSYHELVRNIPNCMHQKEEPATPIKEAIDKIRKNQLFVGITSYNIH